MRCLIFGVSYRGEAIPWRHSRDWVSDECCHGNHFWLSIYGVHIGATWQIQLNRPHRCHTLTVQSYSPGSANVHPIYRKPKNGCHGNVCQKLDLGYVFMRSLKSRDSLLRRKLKNQAPISCRLHRVSKNVPSLACYNFDAHEWILTFFGRNVTDKVDNQKTLYYATSNNLCFCTTRKHENHIFHSIGLCYTHNAPMRYLPERKNCHLWCVW